HRTGGGGVGGRRRSVRAVRRAPVAGLDSPARRRVPQARVSQPRRDPYCEDRRRVAVNRRLTTAGAVAGSLVGLWSLLSIPGAEPPVAPAPERGRAFAWNQDTLWRSLETTYVKARVAGCGTADRAAADGLSVLAATAERLRRMSVSSDAVALDSLEARFFALAPLVAACPRHLRDYGRLSGRLREAIKWQSRGSHVGLVHVDSISHTASVIEAHIERGVAVSTADGYLHDKKLRIMVLRLRADLPALIADPLLPHRAASLALERARSGHIAYDFDM